MTTTTELSTSSIVCHGRRIVRHIMYVATIALVAAQIFSIGSAEAMSRIKDIADFEGVRDNQLIGYGLVAGINGTGDSLTNSPFTRQSIVGMLERLGVNVRGITLNTTNIAAVMITATLPPFVRHGSRLDVTVSALGDASSLLGGTLIATPLLAADGNVYAVAQGQLAVGGFSAEGASGTKISKGVPTSARIAGGAIVEPEVGFELTGMSELNIALRNPDFTTTQRVAQAINASLGEIAAKAIDSGTVSLVIPDRYRDNVAGLLTTIEQLRIEPDQPARVVSAALCCTSSITPASMLAASSDINSMPLTVAPAGPITSWHRRVHSKAASFISSISAS